MKKNPSHQNLKNVSGIVRFPRLIRRFPRRTAEDVAFYRTAYRIAELEKEAHEWIGRGRDANTELGRIFIRLKKLVGRGHFEKYYNRKFGQPYKIAFRTAQVYMRLAREADEGNGADPALFPSATDRQALAIREATERHRLNVAAVEQEGSGDSTVKKHARISKESNKSPSSMCTCRLHIRMNNKEASSVSGLRKSEHWHLAEIEITDFLLKLCAKYQVGSDASEESSD